MNNDIDITTPSLSFFKYFTDNLIPFKEWVLDLLKTSLLLATLGAFLCLVFVEFVPEFWIAKQERQLYDAGLRELVSNGKAVTDSKKSQPFLLVDVDQNSFQELGHYTIFPKEKMADYLNYLAISKAKLAIIDIDFFDMVPSSKLKLAMEAYAGNPNSPPLLLVRAIEGDISDGIGRLPPSDYDDIVETAEHMGTNILKGTL